MALKFADRVAESTVTVGTGDIMLAGPIDADHSTFGNQFADADQMPISVYGGGKWMTAEGRYNLGANSITVTKFRRSSTGSQLALSGTMTVLCGWGADDVALFVRTLPPQGRLTLLSGSPVMSGSQGGKSTLYYTPACGNQIPLYDGVMTAVSFTELAAATTDTTKNPAAIGASKVNDWFVWNDVGTLRLTHGPDWTSDTARSAGTALVMVNGILLNSVAITNGPAASRGTYVGTTRSDASSQLNFVLAGTGSGGVAGNLAVWNMYNRQQVSCAAKDTGAGYSYGSPTIRQARASAGNQVSWVCGLAEDGGFAGFATRIDTSGVLGSYATFGIGLDTTTAYTSTQGFVYASTATSTLGVTGLNMSIPPMQGYHYISSNEASPSGVNGFDGFTDAALNFTMRM